MRMGKMGITFGTATACMVSLFAFSPAAGAAEANKGGDRQAAACTVTLYATAGYQGGKRAFQVEDSTFAQDRWDNGNLMNDDANSAKSNCDQFVTIFEHSYAGGLMTFLDFREHDPTFSDHNMSNKASSLSM